MVPRLRGYLNSPYGYWEYLPKNYYHDNNFPLVIGLHGVSEIGTGESKEELDKILPNGIPSIILQCERDFPFVMIAPQSPSVEEGFAVERLDHLIELIKANYRIDEDRIYVTGLSYGAYATLRLASYLPHKIAAIVPFSSCGGDHDVSKLKDIPMWAFSNTRDKKEIPDCMTELIENIRDQGGTPLFTLYPAKGHNAWARTYRGTQMWEWLLKQRRRHKEENQPPILIDPDDRIMGIGANGRYTLMASDPNNDSLKFNIEGSLTPGSYLKILKNGHAELVWNTLIPGEFDVNISVSDGKGGVSKQQIHMQTSYTLLFLSYIVLLTIHPGVMPSAFAMFLVFPFFITALITQLLSLIAHFFHWLFLLPLQLTFRGY